MARSQNKPKRKISGGIYQRPPKRLSRLARAPTLTKVGKLNIKKIRIKGGKSKTNLLSTNKINVFNPKTKKYQQTEIKTVLENPANRHFVRRNIMTRGTIVDTGLGKVKITSRPGQESTLNGILI